MDTPAEALLTVTIASRTCSAATASARSLTYANCIATSSSFDHIEPSLRLKATVFLSDFATSSCGERVAWYSAWGESNATPWSSLRPLNDSEGKRAACVRSGCQPTPHTSEIILTILRASVPNNRSSPFHAIEAAIFRFESRLRRTSNATPGFMREALIKSVP
jgi:hypothetical protein